MTERFTRRSGRVDDEPWRTPFQRDLDRILYASAYRRLAGVTQVLPASDEPMVHNRLTHTLKVEQVGRRTVQYLLQSTDPAWVDKAGGLDADVVATAAAAHDLGHPPFGHIAEDELQHILNQKGTFLPDSFEGNAQSFRIVTKLSVRKSSAADAERGLIRPDYFGLDLTAASLAAVLKYPWCKGEHLLRGARKEASDYYSKKWGAYESERDTLNQALSVVPAGRVRSLEAEIMDYADDVTYAVHDIEDFFRVGVIPLHQIGLGVIDGKSRVFNDFWDFACAEINAKGEVEFQSHVARERLRRLALLMPDLPYQDSDADRLNLHRFISATVTALQGGISVGPGGQFVEDPDSRMLIEVLKQLTWYFVIEHPTLAAAQQGQRRVIRDLVTWLSEWVKENDPDEHEETAKRKKLERRRERELPARLLSYVATARHDSASQENGYDSRQIHLRGVVDYVSSLTETAAYHLHDSLGGSDAAISAFSGLARWQ